MTSSLVLKELKRLADPKRAEASKWFFKTGKGQYGYGDIFWGVTVPNQRKTARQYALLPLPEVKQLLLSKVHESRLTGLFILVYKYAKGDEKNRRSIVKFYLSNRKRINNWDLVDSSAPYILGEHLATKNDRSILYRMAGSNDLWERRMAIISTFAFIKRGDFKDTLRISSILLSDPHDLIHKAVGWMLRETGKRSIKTEEDFLMANAPSMPRTMLRYAIEKLPEERRSYFLKMSKKESRA